MAFLRALFTPVFNAFPGVPPWLVAVGCALAGAILLWLASRIFKWAFVLAALAFLIAGLLLAFHLAFGH
jgi:hypothetical protein